MEHINLGVLDGVLDRYQTRLSETRIDEVYKWEAIKHFQEAFDLTVEDIPTMLRNAFQVDHNPKLNIVYSYAWNPVGMLEMFVGFDRQSTVTALENLFNEDTDLKTRMVAFDAWATDILNKMNNQAKAEGREPAKNHWQDARAMCAYLTFTHPESHFLYAASHYRNAAKLLGINWPGNKFDKVLAYREMCNQILEHLRKKRPGLIEQSDATLGDLTAYDPEHHMLVQDVVFFITAYDKRDQTALVSSEDWFPSPDVYDPGIDIDGWKALLNNRDVFTKQALEIIYRMRDYGGAATCTQLAQKYGETKNFYLTGSVALAQRVAQETGCPLLEDEENARWWPVVYVGKHADKDEAGSYVWKIRDELSEAMNQANPADVSLYAESETDVVSDAPETDAPQGHWLLVANAKIWSFFGLEVGAKTSYTIYNEKGNPRRIHKNYLAAKPGEPIIGYESSPTRRIVALCEITKEHDDERLYFHKVRDIEGGPTFEQIKNDPILSKCEFSKNPNGSFFYLSDEEYARFVELLGLEGDEDSDDNPIAPVENQEKPVPYTDEDFLADVYVTEQGLHDMKALLDHKRNLILQGSPGTGKTFCAKRLAWTIMGCKDDARITFVQFHQSTSYDDFVCGYRPDGNGGFTIKDGPFVRACREATRDPGRPHFVIIDEINRANISKVLGELLMLIEADHREESILLTISGERLSVPKNLYIIGMMNTADRGLALIDYALRRRFAFFDMEPAFEHPRFLEQLSKSSDPHMKALVEATSEVNEYIADDAALGKGFRIGHSYFCNADNVDLVLRYELAPLIREYWFDDPKKVQQILGKLEQAAK